MPDVVHNDLEREIRASFENIPTAEWVLEMIEYRRRTGTYRPEDLRRLLGDPNKSVEVGPETSLCFLLLDRRSWLNATPIAFARGILVPPFRFRHSDSGFSLGVRAVSPPRTLLPETTHARGFGWLRRS